ncbi:hypothetical protein [Nocardia sp. NPDC050175]|uniref:hypothetical protein n=1 Tax=Nocardia sp. NPDC050175 TaxID=3364317 RepID=UPI0037B754E1
MTSPDRALPAGAYTGSPGARSLTRLASANQQSVQPGVSGEVIRSYAGIPGTLAGVVRSGLHEFAANLCDAITGFTGGLINLGGWAKGLRERAKQAMDDATTAKGSADTAQQTAANTAEVVKATGSRVQVVIDGLPIKPYWETMNLTEEASFPRSTLHRRAWDVADSASAGYEPFQYEYQWGTDADGRPIYDTRRFYVRFAPVYSPPANTLDGAFIRCRYAGGRKIVTYMPDAVTSPCELYVVVGRMLPNGDIQVEWVSENQTPLITNSRFERSVEMPSDIVFAVGETAFVGIQQRGSGNPRPLLGVEATDLPRAATSWPPRTGVRFASSAVLAAGATLATNTLNFGAASVPYVSLSKSLVAGPLPKLAFYEDFNAGYLPRALLRLPGPEATVSGGAFVVLGTEAGRRRYLNGQPLGYDNQMVTGQIVAPSVSHAWLMLRSTPDNKTFVSLNVTQSAVSLFTFASETWTVLSTVETSVAAGEAFRVKAIDNVFTVQRKTTGDWTDLFSYPDTQGLLSKGPGYRYVGLGNERASKVNGGGWDYWKAEDL